MKAISIQQPWAWLIVNGLKDIENRDWTTDYRGLVLIHAPTKVDVNTFYGNSGRFGAFPQWLPDRSFVEQMPTRAEFEDEHNQHIKGIVGYAMLQKVVTQSGSPWFRGKYGFVLTQRHTVPFMPLRGHLGFFDVPKEIEDEINEIREQRAIESEARDYNQIKREWHKYRHEGDETPPTPPSKLW